MRERESERQRRASAAGAKSVISKKIKRLAEFLQNVTDRLHDCARGRCSLPPAENAACIL